MDLYKLIDGQRLKSVKPEDFAIERVMQNIVQDNLDQLFGDAFLAAEFTVGNYRLDTVAFDAELKAFVILEYKNMTRSSVIDQGYSYLNTLMNHKADFILLYNHFYDLNKAEDYFDWSQTKVIFMAKGFTQYQKDAVNNPKLPIELYEINKYANDFVTVNKIEKSNFSQTAHTQVVVSNAKDGDKATSTLTPYTEEDQLSNGSEEVQKLYQKIKESILDWDNAIEVKPLKKYIGFRIRKHSFTDMHVQKKQLKIYINCSKGELTDPLNLTRDVSQIGHWGNGDYEASIRDDAKLEYLLSLIKQAWVNKSKLD